MRDSVELALTRLWALGRVCMNLPAVMQLDSQALQKLGMINAHLGRNI